MDEEIRDILREHQRGNMTLEQARAAIRRATKSERSPDDSSGPPGGRLPESHSGYDPARKILLERLVNHEYRVLPGGHDVELGTAIWPKRSEDGHKDWLFGGRSIPSNLSLTSLSENNEAPVRDQLPTNPPHNGSGNTGSVAHREIKSMFDAADADSMKLRHYGAGRAIYEVIYYLLRKKVEYAARNGYALANARIAANFAKHDDVRDFAMKEFQSVENLSADLQDFNPLAKSAAKALDASANFNHEHEAY